MCLEMLGRSELRKNEENSLQNSFQRSKNEDRFLKDENRGKMTKICVFEKFQKIIADFYQFFYDRIYDIKKLKKTLRMKIVKNS